MLQYLINFNANLGWESDRTVDRNFYNIDKTVKNKYKEILKNNKNITKEGLTKKMNDDLINDKKKYKKGYQDYYNNKLENIAETHETYLKEEKRKEEEADRRRR